MGLRIQNNISAMNTHRQLVNTDSMMAKSLERLSSGYRINKASDDAAGLAISSAFRADIASYKVASRNVSEANALAQVAEGAYDQISNMLVRLKELSTQASSANAGSNLDKINDEGNQLLTEIDRIAEATEYAGSKLLDGSFGVTASDSFTGYVSATGLQANTTYTVTVSGDDVTVAATINDQAISQTIDAGITAMETGDEKTLNFSALGLSMTVDDTAASGTIVTADATATNFQVGAKNTSNDRISFTLQDVSTTTLVLNSDQMLTAADAQSFLDSIDNAINTLNDARGGIGAIQNRLGYAAANLSTTIENVQAAESVIRDVDMAAEMTTFTKSQILLQAGTAMLAQANMAPQGILSLLG
ncbi:MAG: flagellin [Deltaproteobacteria bacterium]|nr:flagellin [Deltaproteobacteria bacterium]